MLSPARKSARFLLPKCDTHLFPPDGRNLIITDRFGGVSLRSLERTGDPTLTAYRLGKPRRFYDGEMLC